MLLPPFSFPLLPLYPPSMNCTFNAKTINFYSSITPRCLVFTSPVSIFKCGPKPLLEEDSHNLTGELKSSGNEWRATTTTNAKGPIKEKEYNKRR